MKTSNQPNPGSAKSNLTMSCSNPFVPASIQSACATNGISSFQYGLDDAILPNPLVEPERTQERFVGGAEGQVHLIGTDWHYDAYYEHGLNVTDINVSNMPLTPRYNQAIQAISPNGQTVCASAAARADGCVPINVFGNVTPSAAALAYIEPGIGPSSTRSRRKTWPASRSTASPSRCGPAPSRSPSVLSTAERPIRSMPILTVTV